MVSLPATKTLPAPSTATPSGESSSLASVVTTPVGVIFRMVLLLRSSATKTLPAPSTATPDGPVESGGGPRAVRASVTERCPRERGHHASRRDLADGAVERVGDEDVARPVHRHALGAAEAGVGTRAVRASAQRAVPASVDTTPSGVTFRMVVVVGDEDVARPVHRHARGHLLEAGGGPVPSALPDEPTVTGQRGHHASRA
jgi:hypothetical protein